ncbi:DNA ligase 3 [Ischnura elegans]|uniref:DNA ligase 3 n=1 Tax=Ischnura elegans TaxID=197161 RepID=UPI001ED8A56E|nr:DNA ligase 3 [Ischnura elegans]
MSDAADSEPEEEKKWFAAEKAKTGRAGCKKCKDKIEVHTLRLAKIVPSPFGGGLMKNWFHPKCFFDSYQKARATTRRLKCPEEELEGWDELDDEYKEEIIALIGSDRVAPKEAAEDGGAADGEDGPLAAPSHRPPPSNPDHKDHAFREFRRLCAEVSNTAAYTEKTAIIKNLLEKGSDGDSYKGDVYLLFRLLLPMAVKRVYNLHNKQLIKLFSKIFGCSMDDMLEDLEKGDVSETIREFFEESTKCPPAKKSKVTMQDVDEWLEDLSKLTKEEEQLHLLTKVAKKCTSNDLKIVIRLIVHDLKTSAGPKHVLEALHPDAYKAFQTSRDLDAVIDKVLGGNVSVSQSPSKPMKAKAGTSLEIGMTLLTPVLPMLAEPCRSVEYAMKKCPNGMISEIKYDGERVQVHKKGKDFKYFSRSLKPVLPHKIAHFKDYIPKAFPYGEDIILDSEILLVDTESGKPLPFGTLGVHKKNAFQNASVCLFVFDCLYYNGKSLLKEPIVERRKFLIQNMKEIKNHVMFSEMKEVHEPKDLEAMISKVLKQGLEGLVLKDLKSAYEPGKRHWLKVKKDYLKGGAMADSADLVVLGAWFGSGSKGGMMSIFLMGCWDPKKKKFCTVTKVHGGHDDKTLEKLQTELQMIKISKDPSRVPDWLICTKTMVPDFVATDPKESPVWEIVGAEFTRHEVHTADGISVRFPRVTAIRTDKTWKEATSLPELQVLYEKSKEHCDFTGLAEEENDDEKEKDDDEGSEGMNEDAEIPDPETPKKGKHSNTPVKKRPKEHIESSDSEGYLPRKKGKSSESEEEKMDKNLQEEKGKEKEKKHKRDPEERALSEDQISGKERSDSEGEVEGKKKQKKKESKSKDSSDDKSGVEDPVPSKKRKDVKAAEESKSERSKDRKHSKHKDSQEREEKNKLKKHKHDSGPGSNSASPDDSKYKVSKKEKKSKGSEDSAEEDKSFKGNEKEKKSSGPKKPIPNIFKGIKLVIPQEEKENHELERHFVAYGGTVLEETDSELATHIVHPTKLKGDNQNHLKWSPEAKAVQLKWILHSIQLKELQDIEKYLIDSHVHESDPL